MNERPILIEGAVSVDDRGQLSFANGFDMKPVRRFYLVSNHESGFIRAWHAHKKEDKYVFVVSGAALVGAVKIDNWEVPDKNAEVHRFVLSDKNPAVLAIPAGYANGFMTLTPGAQVLFFSDKTLEESKGDDFRYDARYWDPWHVMPR